MLNNLELIIGYNINIWWTLCLFTSVIILTVIVLYISTIYSPSQFINLIKDTQELKRLDTQVTHDLKHTGFFTKLAFKIFCKGAERYTP